MPYDLRNLCEMFLTVLNAIDKAPYPEKAERIKKEARKNIDRLIKREMLRVSCTPLK